MNDSLSAESVALIQELIVLSRRAIVKNSLPTLICYYGDLSKKKRGVFYLSLKICSLNRLASYDEYPPVVNITTPNNQAMQTVYLGHYKGKVKALHCTPKE